MIVRQRGSLSLALLAGASAIAISTATPAAAQDAARTFDIPSQPLSSALLTYSRLTDTPVIASMDLLQGKTAPAIKGDMSEGQALAMLLQGTGLRAERGPTGSIVVERASDPQSGSAAGDGADSGTVQALIVTAQKREEDIQDVPIAISAFTQESLTRSQVAGGPDLITQVPNMTFTKTNFSSYSIQIRGIGTQAISATTDPAVAVAFNNTPFIRNRFFEQEFYDLQRVEVLRGPQGTLYGRNATAGVVNIISAKPKFSYEAKASADLGNYSSSRFEGMVNIPLVEDKMALRLAGAWTKRDGYATNQITDNPIDGRDLWSTRLSLRFAPTDRIDANLIWEHFEEDDDRLRSGKQLCKKDVVTQIAGFPVTYYQLLPETGLSQLFSGVQGTFSQGCTRNSLYAPDSFETVNGLSVPYYTALGSIKLPIALSDPYASTVQSRDLRTIESTVDPGYRAKSDLAEIQIAFDITDDLTVTSETSYNSDTIFSLQDFNRFNTAAGAWQQPRFFDRPGVMQTGPNGGIFCDPQLGCSDRLVAVDLSTADSRQFSQEFRLSSNFSGPFNFSLGGNFLRYDTVDKYYVFINSLSLISAQVVFGADGLGPYVSGKTDNLECLERGPAPGDPTLVYPVAGCTYIDPNPIGSLNDQGHNYFLSKNPYKLISYAVFGEAYYNITENLKATAGLRWTVDKKEAPRIPSWTLASDSFGYPVAEVIEQEWREPTGRLAIDWKPVLSFTDDTLLYASYAHGYKAGGANPPRFTYVFYGYNDVANGLASDSATRPKTFDPEFVNAFELGAKNTLLDGKVTLNLAAFYYDYAGYQVSEIVDRSAFNRNFDADVWGVEMESEWRPLDNLKLGVKAGYERTRIADGEQAIDLMDRTAGHDDWITIRPFPTFASNCILPLSLFVGRPFGSGPLQPVNLGGVGGGNPGGCELAYVMKLDPVTRLPYVANPTIGAPNSNSLSFYTDYPGFDPATAPNNGEGFFKQLGGNELPNAPHWTATFTGDYSLPLPNDWLMTLHSDVHWQSQSWWRVFNDDTFDKLHPYFTMNLAAIFTNEERGWNIMAYIKNVTDETAITGAFLNSDDTGHTTNVFLTEPRLYGLRVTKSWTGGPLFGGFGARHAGPYPLTLELGGQVQRYDAINSVIRPGFASAFAPELDLFGAAQNRNLDHGDGRDVKLTWQPAGGLKVSAGVRFGKTNGGGARLRAEGTSEAECAFGGFYGAILCPIYEEKYGVNPYISGPTWTDDSATMREDYRLIDFSVGKDVNFGSLSSSFAVGLRTAKFESATTAHMTGIPDWNIAPGFVFPTPIPYTHSLYGADFDARREFKGAGPIVNWSASYPLLGGEETGQIKTDWSITAGALFGKQSTSITGLETRQDFANTANFSTLQDGLRASAPLVTVPTDVSVHRSRSSTVPVVDASLGLSYTLDRVSLGAGYRWERYFNVLDAGDAERKQYDRTIDGPYLKVSVGFGS